MRNHLLHAMHVVGTRITGNGMWESKWNLQLPLSLCLVFTRPRPLFPFACHLPVASFSEASSPQPHRIVRWAVWDLSSWACPSLGAQRTAEHLLLILSLGPSSHFQPFLSLLTLRNFLSLWTLLVICLCFFGPQTTLQLLKPFPNLPPQRAFLASC